MFFAIATKSLMNFPRQEKLGPYTISVDDGWHLCQRSQLVFLWKGYCDQGPVEDLLDEIYQQTQPDFTGNFCVFIFEQSTDKLLIRNDRYRGFPIYVGQNIVTNLVRQDHTVWADSIIELDKDFKLTETKFDLIGSIDTAPVTESQVVDFIQERIDHRTECFLKNNTLPIKAFVSGGVDSMLVFSFLKKHTANFQFIKCRHIDYDDFWLENLDQITQYWGYQQIHHWVDPCVLTSGAPGDEFCLRSPTTAGMFCRYYGRNILDELESDQWSSCMHHTYYLRKKNIEVFENIQVDQTQDRQSFFWDLCNINVNDWQHWHIGNTLTWTPLKDLEIFKMFLRLPIDVALGQIMDSSISKQVIERNSPGLSKHLSSQKNAGAYMSNLKELYQQYI